MWGQSGTEGGKSVRDESGVSPVIGTILLVALTAAVGTGAAVTATSVDLPGGSPEGDMVVGDAVGGLGTGADDLVELRHRGGDAVPLDELEVVVETPNGTRLTYTDGDLELRDEPDGDGVLETGDVLVVSEVPCVEGEGSDDHDKGHGNDADGYDEDNPGKSKGAKGKNGNDGSGDSDKGHGNDDDGYDEDNPGKSKGAKGKNGNDGSDDSDKGHGNDADGYDEDNPGKSTGVPNKGGSGDGCCDISDVDELEVSVFHLPTESELIGTGVNVE